MKAEDLDRQFDNGEDILHHFDLARARRPGLAKQQVIIELPTWLVAACDLQAQSLQIDRQTLIERWLRERVATPQE